MSTASSSLFVPASAGASARVLVIAELGVNHDGKLGRALELTDMAAAVGADAIKLQLFDPRNLLSNQARLADYQKEAGAADPFEMLRTLHLGVAEMRQVRAAAKGVGVKFIVTPFSLPDIPGVRELDVDAVKIASPDAVNVPLLQAAATLGKPLLISTGTCALSELEFAADLLRQHAPGGALLHCVSSYPTTEDNATLGGIPALGQRFGLPVGYSDHTTELITGALAVCAGACVVEKHFTHNRNAAGPDHAASLDPVGFDHYVALVHQAVQMHGSVVKRVLPCEQDVCHASRQSVCALRDLPAGHVLTVADLTIKRPGAGIPARQFEETLGRKLSRAVKANDLLQAADLA